MESSSSDGAACTPFYHPRSWTRPGRAVKRVACRATCVSSRRHEALGGPCRAAEKAGVGSRRWRHGLLRRAQEGGGVEVAAPRGWRGRQAMIGKVTRRGAGVRARRCGGCSEAGSDLFPVGAARAPPWEGALPAPAAPRPHRGGAQRRADGRRQEAARRAGQRAGDARGARRRAHGVAPVRRALRLRAGEPRLRRAIAGRRLRLRLRHHPRRRVAVQRGLRSGRPLRLRLPAAHPAGRGARDAARRPRRAGRRRHRDDGDRAPLRQLDDRPVLRRLGGRHRRHPVQELLAARRRPTRCATRAR